MGRMDFGVCSQATPVPSKRRMWEGVQPMVDWMCVCVCVVKGTKRAVWIVCISSGYVVKGMKRGA